MSIETVSPVGLEHVDSLRQLYAGEWWTKMRSRDDTEALLRGSTSTVGLLLQDKLIGFARVLSDGYYLALVLDVIVAKDYRGQGLGDRLMREVLNLPEVRAVASVELVCQPELQVFYARHDFTNDVGASTLMRRTSDPALSGSRI